MKVAIAVYGPEPWQVNAFRNGEKWLGVITGWTLSTDVTDRSLVLELRGEVPERIVPDGVGLPFSLSGPVTALYGGDRDSAGSPTAYEAHLGPDGREPLFLVEAFIPEPGDA